MILSYGYTGIISCEGHFFCCLIEFHNTQIMAIVHPRFKLTY